MATLGFMCKVIHLQSPVVMVWFSHSCPQGQLLMTKVNATTDCLHSPSGDICLNMESELNSYLFWAGPSYQDLNLVLRTSHEDVILQVYQDGTLI